MWNLAAQERLSCIPRLYETESMPMQGKIVYFHLFIGNSDWHVCEFNSDNLFFGYTTLNGDHLNAEWGYISFSELKDISINGIEVDCEPE